MKRRVGWWLVILTGMISLAGGRLVAAEVTVTYPAKGNINLDCGTVEMWVKPLFQDTLTAVPEEERSTEYNRDIWYFRTAKGDMFNLYWGGNNPGLVAFTHFADTQDYPGIWFNPFWTPGEWHHIALTWSKEKMSIWSDGELLGEYKKEDISKMSIFAEIVLGGRSAFLIDEFRISDIIRTSFDLNQPPIVDEHTLLLDRFDEDFTPDGRRRTKAVKISKECGVSGGLVSKDAKFVPGKFGQAIQLLSETETSDIWK